MAFKRVTPRNEAMWVCGCVYVRAVCQDQHTDDTRSARDREKKATPTEVARKCCSPHGVGGMRGDEWHGSWREYSHAWGMGVRTNQRAGASGLGRLPTAPHRLPLLVEQVFNFPRDISIFQVSTFIFVDMTFSFSFLWPSSSKMGAEVSRVVDGNDGKRRQEDDVDDANGVFSDRTRSFHYRCIVAD